MSRDHGWQAWLSARANHDRTERERASAPRGIHVRGSNRRGEAGARQPAVWMPPSPHASFPTHLLPHTPSSPTRPLPRVPPSPTPPSPLREYSCVRLGRNPWMTSLDGNKRTLAEGQLDGVVPSYLSPLPDFPHQTWSQTGTHSGCRRRGDHSCPRSL